MVTSLCMIHWSLSLWVFGHLLNTIAYGTYLSFTELCILSFKFYINLCVQIVTTILYDLNTGVSPRAGCQAN